MQDKNPMISTHITYAEAIYSATAKAKGIDNFCKAKCKKTGIGLGNFYFANSCDYE